MSVDPSAATLQRVAVSLARHGHLRWRKPQNYGFARGIDLVPVALPDVLPLASAFALVFAGADFVPCAVLRHGGQENGYISGDGTWLGGLIPPMLQAYPFDVAPYGAADLMLMVDETSGLVDQSLEGAAFFEPDGALSPQIKKIIAFCRKHGDAPRRAAQAVAAIDALGLFDPMPGGVYWINQARYHALTDKDILALRGANALDLIVAHFVSVAHLSQTAPQKRDPARVQNIDDNLQDFLAAMAVETPYHETGLVHF